MEDSSQEFLQEQQLHQSLQQQVEQEETTSISDKLCISTRHMTLPENIVTGITMWSSQASTNISQVCYNHL